jgi:hypothetical protein
MGAGAGSVWQAHRNNDLLVRIRKPATSSLKDSEVMKMTSRIEALEQKASSAVPCKIHPMARAPYSSSEEAVAAFKQYNPGTQDDEFIVVVGLSALPHQDANRP